MRTYQKGEIVVFRKQKSSASPGSRAKDVHPYEFGEEYSYAVDKFWIVVDQQEDGTLLLKTRRGKEHRISADDDRLRRPSLWERLFWRHKFPNDDLAK